MKPVKQTTEDNCLPACLASLLGVPIQIIPNHSNKPYLKQVEATQRWLRKLGHSLLYVPINGNWRKRKTWRTMAVPAWCIVGILIKNTGNGHVMVGRVDRNGIKVVHDPSYWTYKPSEYTVDSLLFLIPAVAK